MSSYKFTYFDVTAKGETSRTLFAMAGVKFDDVRLADDGDWDKLKPSTPFGQLPTLQVDGMKICQSKAIERLLAKRFGFYGDSDLDQTKADMVVDCSDEIRSLLIQYIYYTEEDKKEEVKKTFMEEKGPRMFGNLEKMLQENGHFIGNKLSWPDVDLFNVIDFAQDCGKLDLTPILSTNQQMQKLVTSVKQNDNIAQWLKNRPKST